MADPAWLTIDHLGERRHVRLDLKLTTIGRNEANVVDLPDKKLSRFHCEIERRGDDYVVKDSGSRNGTMLNGTKLAGPTVLEAGDLIEIGESQLLFRTDRPIDADPANNLMAIAPLPKSLRRATTKRQLIDLSGATPDEPFDPRPTIAQAPLAKPPPPPPPPTPPLVESAQGSRSLARATSALAGATTREGLLQRLAALALDLVPGRQASVFLPHGTTVRAVAVHPPQGDPRASSAMVEEVLKTGQPVSVQDLKQDAQWGTGFSVLGLDLRGAIGAPLLALGRTRGVLYVDEPRAVGQDEREEAVSLLAGLAAAGGLALVATGGTLAGDEERQAAEADRAARLAVESLPPASAIQLALRIRPGSGAFFETQVLPERGGRRELAILCGLASGAPLATLAIESATRGAFRALARTVTKGGALLGALVSSVATLERSSLALALLRVDPLTGEVAAGLAGLGPLLHRSKDGHVFAIDAAPLGAETRVEEHAIGWGPGDLLLLAAPAPEDVRIAPWIGETTGLGAGAALERAASELPEAAAFLALQRS